MLLVKKAYSLPLTPPSPRKTWTIQPGLGLPPPVNSASLSLAFSPGLEWLPLWLRVEENSPGLLWLSTAVCSPTTCNLGLRSCYKHGCSEEPLCAWESCSLVSVNAVSLNPQSPKQVLIFVPENKDRIQKKNHAFWKHLCLPFQAQAAVVSRKPCSYC